MDDCIFCLIVEGKIPSSKVFESENVYAFLDLNPANKGHTLVIPKKHCATVFDADPAVGCELLSAIQKVGKAIMEVTGAAGMNVVQNNGRAAGQEVDHLHFHLIPCFDRPSFKLWEQKKYDSMQEMADWAAKIKEKIGE